LGREEVRRGERIVSALLREKKKKDVRPPVEGEGGKKKSALPAKEPKDLFQGGKGTPCD